MLLKFIILIIHTRERQDVIDNQDIKHQSHVKGYHHWHITYIVGHSTFKLVLGSRDASPRQPTRQSSEETGKTTPDISDPELV